MKITFKEIVITILIFIVLQTMVGNCTLRSSLKANTISINKLSKFDNKNKLDSLITSKIDSFSTEINGKLISVIFIEKEIDGNVKISKEEIQELYEENNK